MKELLIFLAGLGIGSGVTYIALKDRFDEQLEEEVSELMDYRRENPRKPKKGSKRVKKASEEPVEEEIEESEDDDLEEDKEAYSKIVKANYSKPDPGEIAKNKKKRHRDDNAEKIFLLSPKAFAASENDTPTVYLYGDGVVVDEDDNVVDNGYALLGGADVIREAENTGDTTVYIRNLNNSTDYEVVMCSENYGTIETEDPAPEDS